MIIENGIMAVINNAGLNGELSYVISGILIATVLITFIIKAVVWIIE